MKTLTLLRHAKSAWDDPVARDFDRPLNAKGQKAAVTIGRRAAEMELSPQRLVASPALRVKQTLISFTEGMAPHSPAAIANPVWDQQAYLASSATLLDIIRATSDDVDHLMLTGHNPGLEDLILDLVADDGSSPLRDIVETKYPTASLAQLVWDGDSWGNLDADTGARLTVLIRPRDLDPTLGPDYH